MSAHSQRVIQEFCVLCDWTFQAWLNHKELFENNPRERELQKSMGGEALGRISTISQEYVLLQIAKLHDPITVSHQITLGIDYIVEYGGWNEGVYSKLSDLSAQLVKFTKGLRTVRNKALAHNDLGAILSNVPLSGFEKDADICYSKVLQEFVNLVHSEIIGGPYPFNDLAKNDAIALLAIIKP